MANSATSARGLEAAESAVSAPSSGTPLPKDEIAFSQEARAAAERESSEKATPPSEGEGLTEEEKREVENLKKRDAEVRAHEQAHISAGGQYVQGSANFSYTVGPNRQRYATGGEVSIDVGEASTPSATIQKMQAVRRAALAPANPSSQDLRVAAQAAQAESKARAEMTKEGWEPASGKSVEKSKPPSKA